MIFGEKYDQDIVFLTATNRFGMDLTEHSLFLSWFPNEINSHIEFLCAQRPLEKDFGGLMTLMMFAGLADEEDDYMKYLIKTVFDENSLGGSNAVVDYLQNCAVFLFGITMDDVSEMCLTPNSKTCTNLRLFRELDF
jgi:hypothetical protein